jgi:hypothetical protein
MYGIISLGDNRHEGDVGFQRTMIIVRPGLIAVDRLNHGLGARRRRFRFGLLQAAEAPMGLGSSVGSGQVLLFSPLRAMCSARAHSNCHAA